MDFETVEKKDYVLKALKYARRHPYGFRKADLDAHLGIILNKTEENGKAIRHPWEEYFDTDPDGYFSLIGKMDEDQIPGFIKTIDCDYHTLSSHGRSELNQREAKKWAIVAATIGLVGIIVVICIA